MNASESAGSLLTVSRTEARVAVRKALKRWVGTRRAYSYKLLQRRTGVPARMIEAAMCEPDDPQYRPLNLESLFSIGKELGPTFVTEALAPTGMAAFELPAQDAIPLPVLVADAADSTAEIAAIAADDRICAQDRAELIEVGHRDIARGIHLLSRAKGLKAGFTHLFQSALHWPRLRRAQA